MTLRRNASGHLIDDRTGRYVSPLEQRYRREREAELAAQSAKLLQPTHKPTNARNNLTMTREFQNQRPEPRNEQERREHLGRSLEAAMLFARELERAGKLSRDEANLVRQAVIRE